MDENKSTEVIKTQDKKDVVGLEVAEADFHRWAEGMDLDLDTTDMDAEDLTAFNKSVRRLTTAIRKGSLLVNDEGLMEYTPANALSTYKGAIIFRERTGAACMAMDRFKKTQDIAKTYAVMADMCKVPIKAFSGLVGIDAKVCQDIFVFLMD